MLRRLTPLIFSFFGAMAFAAPITITHEYGTVQVPVKPIRAAVFSYDILDTLDALGAPVLGLPKSNVPPSLAKYKGEAYQDLGTLFEPNFEKLYSLKPDVIFISLRQAKLYAEFAKIAPTVYLAAKPEDFANSVRSFNQTLARIYDAEPAVEARLVAFAQATASLSAAVKNQKRTALVLMVNDKALSVFGPGSRFGMLHDGFGFAPADPAIAVSTHGQPATFEYLKEKNPDVLFVLDRSAAIGAPGTAVQVLDNPLVKGLKAYQSGRVIYLDGPAWYLTTGGLASADRMLADAKSGLK